MGYNLKSFWLPSHHLPCFLLHPHCYLLHFPQPLPLPPLPLPRNPETDDVHDATFTLGCGTLGCRWNASKIDGMDD